MGSKSPLNSSENLTLLQKGTTRTRERLWSTTVSALIAVIPALLVGFTLGYPSPALLDLGDLSEDYRFNTLLSDLFGVSYVQLPDVTCGIFACAV